MTKVKFISLKNYIKGGFPQEKDFETKEVELNETLGDNQILVKLIYISVDPYVRGRMSEGKSYIDPFKVGEPIECGGVGKIEKSNCSKWKVGEYIACNSFPWKEKFVTNGTEPILYKADKDLAPLPCYLSLLGMTGMTGYLGLTEIGEPKKGETLVVSAGSGAVGQVVGQVGKLLGCKVIGIAGSKEKCDFMTKELGFDISVNYKSPTYKDDIAKAVPNGVDIYWENVGGDISDAIWPHLNKYARIPLCGIISAYNKTEMDVGPRLQMYLLKSSAKMQGFIVFNFFDKFPAATKQLAEWYNQGKIKDFHSIKNGFQQVIPSFLSLFDSNHLGKMIIKIAEE
ncbi:hypothetical protein RB653_000337 [Dictyostelium firmibasis]|uniref:NADP-dependent oxidoreductase n=1 Tax=Dictyostelium firmibasis TaxID=79012 RepID=A0AAN7YU99_9MYCE